MLIVPGFITGNDFFKFCATDIHRVSLGDSTRAA